MPLPPQTRDVDAAVVSPVTEPELAAWLRRRRTPRQRVVLHRGRYWVQTRLGFYQPIHLLARLSAEQATGPTRLRWGDRSALCTADASAANGSVPVHVLSDVEEYSEACISPRRRLDLRKCRRLVRIVELAGPALLEADGYEVLRSAITRRRDANAKLPTRAAYLATVADRSASGRHLLTLGGLLGTRLGGYITGYAVDGTAYVDEVMVTTEALRTHIGSGLIHEFICACRRSGMIREVVYGQPVPENPSLGVFRCGMGFPVEHVPAKIHMEPIVARLFRRRYPYAYYRLTGQLPPSHRGP